MREKDREPEPANDFYEDLGIVEDANASENERSDAFNRLLRMKRPFTDDNEREWPSLWHFAAHHAGNAIRRMPPWLHSRIDRQSVANMALLRFYDFAPSIKGNRWAWLAGTAKGLARAEAGEENMFRGRTIRTHSLDDAPLPVDVPPTAEIDEERVIASTEWKALIRQALAASVENLSPVLRETMRLWLAGRSMAEIANIRGVSEGSVRAAVCRGRAELPKTTPALLRELQRLKKASQPTPGTTHGPSAPGLRRRLKPGRVVLPA